MMIMNKEQQLNELSELITTKSHNLQLYLLLRNKYPFLISDMSAFQSFLISSDKTEEYKLNILKALIQINHEKEKRRKHTKGYKDNPYKRFCELYPTYNLNEQVFGRLYNSVSSVEISKSVFKYCDHSLKTVELIKNLKITPINVLDFLCENTVITPEYFCQHFNIGINENKESVKELIKLFRNDKAITLYDSLSYFTIKEDHNDVCIENKILYYRIFDNMESINNKVVIYNPNLLFIKQFVSDQVLRNTDKVVFIVTNKTIQKIINYRYNHLNVYYSLNQIDDKEEFIIDNFLLFFNSNDIINKESVIETIYRKSSNKKGLVFGFDSISNYLSKYNINQIVLFPSKINYCSLPSLKRLCYLTDHKTTTIVWEYSLDNKGSKQYLTVKGNQHEIDLNNNSFRSIREFFTSKEKHSDNKRNRYQIINICNEINIYWTSSTPNEIGLYKEIRIYVKEPILENGVVKEGTKIKESTKKISNVLFPELNDIILQEYFDHSIGNKYIRETYFPLLKKLYKGKEVTLRFLLITYPDFINSLNQELKEIYNITSQSDLYDLFPSQISAEQIDNYANTHLKNEDLSIILKSLLNKLFLFSIDNGYSSINPLKNEINRITKEAKRINEIIRNLSSSRISNKSTFIYIDECKKHILKSENEYLGALLRISTSLSTQLIRALKWRDFQRVTVGTITFHRLIVRRQINKDNTEYISLSKETQYILIPLPSIVSSIMEKSWEEILTQNPNVQETELRQKPIVPGNDFYIDGYGIISYYHLDIIINKIIDRNKLIPKKKIYMLKGDNNLFLKELSTVDTDIFRIFYKNRCEDYQLDPNETSFLLGNKAHDTYATNYCDFRNDFSQLILYKEIERMFSKVTTKENKTARKKKSINILSYKTNNSNRSELTIDVKNMRKISIEAHHGFSLKINELEENENDQNYF